MKNSFDVLKTMAADNKDIRLFPDMVQAYTDKKGGVVCMGVNKQTLLDIWNNPNLSIMLLVYDKKQFDEIAGIE